jgi:hypothetical protein
MAMTLAIRHTKADGADSRVRGLERTKAACSTPGICRSSRCACPVMSLGSSTGDFGSEVTNAHQASPRNTRRIEGGIDDRLVSRAGRCCRKWYRMSASSAAGVSEKKPPSSSTFRRAETALQCVPVSEGLREDAVACPPGEASTVVIRAPLAWREHQTRTDRRVVYDHRAGAHTPCSQPIWVRSVSARGAEVSKCMRFDSA